MVERRDTNAISSAKKKKLRIGVVEILAVAFAFTLLTLLSISRSLKHSYDDTTKSNTLRSQRVPLGVPPPSDRHANDVIGKGNNAENAIQNNVVGQTSGNSFHFIVSSDCTSYQRWEVLTQLHSAQSISQCGRFTWIVSGWYVSSVSV